MSSAVSSDLASTAQDIAPGLGNHFLILIFFSLQICNDGEISLQPANILDGLIGDVSVLAERQRTLMYVCFLWLRFCVPCPVCLRGNDSSRGDWASGSHSADVLVTSQLYGTLAEFLLSFTDD